MPKSGSFTIEVSRRHLAPLSFLKRKIVRPTRSAWWLSSKSGIDAFNSLTAAFRRIAWPPNMSPAMAIPENTAVAASWIW